ncbi:MAG TPA: phosphoribosylamine--glycine ligase [Phycisphaerales bacterium]|nr:phosphoribosylamine--glycine ligase [Phycisphaerales bacterium]HMP37145.1 phosphoribosylamine--glycine ligase [Phycisphaerales bacterium]
MTISPTLPSPCNVLLVGGGGREHALAWKLRRSPSLGTLWCTECSGAPLRNPGILALAREAPAEEVTLGNPFRARRWCEREGIHLIVVGPEGPLAAGIADALAAPDRLVFGPSKAGARIEADKAWAKQLMRSAAIPTAEARIFDDAEAAQRFVRAREQPWVVKASGLAAGKGVIVCSTPDEAADAIERIMVRREFGEAGSIAVVEERLSGPEASVLALVDGRTIWILDPCQDHKRLGDGDTGPNTGGMGAYCPAPVLSQSVLAQVQREVFVPIMSALAREGIEYRGVLYAGLMLAPGGPKVLEFNCRFGDPECQALLPRLEGDLLAALWATAAGTLEQVDLTFDARTCCCVVMASAGYPGAPRLGVEISGLDDAGSLAGVGEELVIFHAGTARDAKGRIVTGGGRVLGVTALAADLDAARRLATGACDRIAFAGAQYRRDIGAGPAVVPGA